MSHTVALIPARGGSKGLPGKNIRTLGGHPLIAWSIAAAKASPAVDRVICSTDSEDIATVARRYGAEVPFMRPAALAADFSTDLDVFQHALDWLTSDGATPDLFVQLRPTTPFRQAAWIDESVRRMKADQALTCVRSVALADHSPYKMWKIGGDDLLAPILHVDGMAEPFNMPRQALPVTYRHTGQLDVIRSSVIAANSMTGAHIAPLTVNAEDAVDIDTLNDFRFAELVFEEHMPMELRQQIAALAPVSA